MYRLYGGGCEDGGPVHVNFLAHNLASAQLLAFSLFLSASCLSRSETMEKGG